MLPMPLGFGWSAGCWAAFICSALFTDSIVVVVTSGVPCIFLPSAAIFSDIAAKPGNIDDNAAACCMSALLSRLVVDPAL